MSCPPKGHITVELFLRGYRHLNINAFILTPDERPHLSKGYISAAKGLASQEGFYCILAMLPAWSWALEDKICRGLMFEIHEFCFLSLG